ncbi:hypothetical protein Pfo_017516 [Paulownia fortunei]|nr:hypothetical protein Pfo_017516 [Paulownia fortunei]
MAQNKNSRKSEGLCQKLHNAVSPFRARMRRISFQPQGSISITSDKKPLSQTTENPVRNSTPQTKPVRVLHQPSLSKMVTVEFEPPAAHFSAQKNKALATLSPVVQSAGKGNSTGKPVQDFAEREVVIVNGQKFAKSVSRKKEVAQPEKAPTVAPTQDKPPNHVPFAKARSKKDDDAMHEVKFSDYISKVKERMLKTASNVGGGGGTSPKKDSFDDKVTNYINYAKIKLRTTTSIGDEKSVSLK